MKLIIRCADNLSEISNRISLLFQNKQIKEKLLFIENYDDLLHLNVINRLSQYIFSNLFQIFQLPQFIQDNFTHGLYITFNQQPLDQPNLWMAAMQIIVKNDQYYLQIFNSIITPEVDKQNNYKTREILIIGSIFDQPI